MCHAQRHAKATARREFSLFCEVRWVQTEHGPCWVLRLPCPNHSGGQLKPTGWVLNFGTINCSITLCSNHGGVLCKPAKAGLAPRVNLVYLKHRKYPPSDHPRTSSDPGYSGGIRSYGALFFTKRSTKPELISKMEFPIDLGFSLVDRYIVTALGKIKKQFLSVLKHF